MTKKKTKIGNLQSSQNYDSNDFDLKKNLGKLNQRTTLPETYTSTEHIIEDTKSAGIKSDFLANDGLGETKLLLKLNDKFYDKIDNLKTEIFSTNEKIGQNTDSLRNELENKIDKKVSEKIFYGAISVIILIAGIIYTLSYSNMITKVENNTQDIDKLEIQNNSIESKLQKKENEIEIRK